MTLVPALGPGWLDIYVSCSDAGIFDECDNLYLDVGKFHGMTIGVETV